MYMCVRGIRFVSFSTIFILDFGIVPTMWHFFIFFLFYHATIVEQNGEIYVLLLE